MSWKVGSSLVKLPSTSLRHCSTPTRSRQHSAPCLVKWSSGADATKPTRLIWVGMDILTPELGSPSCELRSRVGCERDDKSVGAEPIFAVERRTGAAREQAVLARLSAP